MMRSTKARACAVATMAVVTLACSTSAPAAPVALAPDSLRSVPSLEFSSCGEGLECADIAVPVNYDDPGQGTLTLPVIRHRALKPEQRIGVLFTGPGGPGASTVDNVRSATTPPARYFGQEVLDRFDIVAVEARGVGGTGAVSCLTDAQREENLAADGSPFAMTPEERERHLRVARELADACGRTQDAAVLASLSTVNAVHDIDFTRAALDEEQITFLGLSYHTLVGATYGAVYPDRLRAMVLDSTLAPRLWLENPLQATLEQADSAEKVLDAYLHSCREAGSRCPLGVDPGATYDGLVRALEDTPLVVTPAQNGKPATVLDGAKLELAARTAVFHRSFWPVLTQGLVAAQQGDGKLLYQVAETLSRNPDGTPNRAVEANMAINCLDREHPRDIAAYDGLEQRMQQVAPRFGPGNGFIVAPCAYWPVQAADRFTGPFRTTAPVMIAAHTLDSQTPYHWALQMRAALGDTAKMLTVEGTGHGVYGGRANGACVDDTIDRFLLTGEERAHVACVQTPAASAALPEGTP